TMSLIKTADSFDQRRDRFLMAAYDSLHQFVPDHKVRSAGILIDQQKRSACFHGIYSIGCLGSTSAGVFRGKRSCIFTIWKIIDEKRNIGAADTPSILSPQFKGGVVGNDIFPAVSGDMVVDAQLQRLQQSGFSVVSA